MTELRNVELELSRFRGRLLAAGLFILLGFGVLTARLLYLQVMVHEQLATQAEANRISVLPIAPNRGLIYDRNGNVLAENYSAYTLEITRSRLEEDLETVIERLGTVVTIEARDKRRFKRMAEDTKSFEPVALRTRLTDEEVSRFIAQRYLFPGVEVKARLFRNYPYGEVGSHVLGYIGRITARDQAVMETWNEDDQANYRGTDMIGKLGVEQSYERELHGITGVDEVETSAAGNPVRRLRTEPSVPGNSIHLSIDIKLQKMVEDAFGKRRGALVAIDPRSGEVLAYVSNPTFDPNLFVDGIDQDTWKELNESTDRPMLNRALRGTYPPGSTYKPFMALAALNTGKRDAKDIVVDRGFYDFANHRFRSHGDGGLGNVDMVRSIVLSSNVYYYSLAHTMGVDLIHDQMEPFGFGRKTGIDLIGEATGDLPSIEWKKHKFKRPSQQRWYAGETISLGIGQGYNNFTMTQLASAMATLSSGGQRFEPRLVREIEDVETHQRRKPFSTPLEPLALKPEHVDVIRRGMYGVTTVGTSRQVFWNARYKSGGKTGTAQAKSLGKNEKYNAARLSEYQRDHSLYVAFAPLDEPRVALAVVVENAGFGADAAAPIARRVLDYVLLDQHPSDLDMSFLSRGQAKEPVSAPLRVADVKLPSARTMTNNGAVQAGSSHMAEPFKQVAQLREATILAHAAQEKARTDAAEQAALAARLASAEAARLTALRSAQSTGITLQQESAASATGAGTEAATSAFASASGPILAPVAPDPSSPTGVTAAPPVQAMGRGDAGAYALLTQRPRRTLVTEESGAGATVDAAGSAATPGAPTARKSPVIDPKAEATARAIIAARDAERARTSALQSTDDTGGDAPVVRRRRLRPSTPDGTAPPLVVPTPTAADF